MTEAGLAYLPPGIEELDVSHCRGTKEGRKGWRDCCWMGHSIPKGPTNVPPPPPSHTHP